MTIASWLRPLKAAMTRNASRRPIRKWPLRRMRLETLEDRVVPAVLNATYLFQDNLNAQESSAPALTSIDPLGLNTFETATVFGQERRVLHLDGNELVKENAGLLIDANGVVSGSSYSVEVVFALVEPSVGQWHKILDVHDRQFDSGWYLNYADQLSLFEWDGAVVQGEIALGPTVVSTTEFHHIVLTVDLAGVSGYVDGSLEFTSAPTPAMQLESNQLMYFFLDDVMTGGVEVSDARIALLRVYSGTLDATEVESLSNQPFNLPSVTSLTSSEWTPSSAPIPSPSPPLSPPHPACRPAT